MRTPPVARSTDSWDESDVRIRPNKKGTRPRTKDRPAYDDAVTAPDGDAQPRERLDDRPHRAQARVRVAVEQRHSPAQGGDRRDEPHDRPGQSAVDVPPGPGAVDADGRDCQVGTEIAVPRNLRNGGPELLQCHDHERGIPGMQRGPQP